MREIPEQVLLQCHACSEQRRDLLAALNKVLQLHKLSNLLNHAIVRALLYGEEGFTYIQSLQSLTATVRFIRTSERFPKDYHSIILFPLVKHVITILFIIHVSIMPRIILKSPLFSEPSRMGNLRNQFAKNLQ